MKKITLLLAIVLTAIGVQAQNKYNASTAQSTYTNLENPTSINNGEVWDWNTFDEVTIPFDFKIADKPVNRFLFEDDYFVFLGTGSNFDTNQGTIFYFNTTVGFIQDRTFSTGVSSSPISYKTEGAAGNRILKIELQNIGLEDAVSMGFDEDHFFLNIQVWLYESDKSIEVHYGDHNITSFSDLTEDEDFIYFAGMEETLNGDSVAGYVLQGQSTNPTYSEFDGQNIPETFVSDNYPASGTVYKLTPNQTAGLDDLKIAPVTLYPNPAVTMLTIESPEFTSTEYAIYNIEGRMIAHNTINDTNKVQINVENLESGIYFVQINDQHLKFIKK